jgi:hypothetical protein
MGVRLGQDREAREAGRVGAARREEGQAVSRETIAEYQAEGARPRSVTVTITTDALGRVTVEAADLPMREVPALLHEATRVIKRTRSASLRGDS